MERSYRRKFTMRTPKEKEQIVLESNQFGVTKV